MPMMTVMMMMTILTKEKVNNNEQFNLFHPKANNHDSYDNNITMTTANQKKMMRE